MHKVEEVVFFFCSWVIRTSLSCEMLCVSFVKGYYGRELVMPTAWVFTRVGPYPTHTCRLHLGQACTSKALTLTSGVRVGLGQEEKKILENSSSLFCLKKLICCQWDANQCNVLLVISAKYKIIRPFGLGSWDPLESYVNND